MNESEMTWMDVPSDAMDFDQARQAVRELRKKVIELSNLPRTVTEFADRCRECGAKYGKLLKQQPCDDAISRQAVLEILKDKWNMFSDANDAMQESIDTIESLRPVTPQQKVGKWIFVHPLQADDGGAYICSCCEVGDWNLKGTEKFCPNCGAKMQEVEESEEEK